MRTTPSAMTTTLAGDSLRLIHLVELRLSQATYRYALSPVDITFAGVTYTATAGAFTEVQESAQREVPQFRLVLQNVDGVLGGLVDPLASSSARDARGKRVVVTTVTEADIADSTAKVEDTFVISSYVLTRQAAVFVLGNPMAVALDVPARVIGTTLCPWVYKGKECGSLSTEKACPKTLAACKERFPVGEPLRFGGEPGRSRVRRLIL